MARLAVVFVVIAIAVTICSSQLNFSTGWGKRAISGSSGGSAAGTVGGGANMDPSCKNPMEALMLIYKLVQNEAQKMLECEKF